MRYYIEIEGRRVRLINTAKIVFEPKPGYACSYSASQARHWVDHLAAKGIEATLIDTGDRGSSEWAKAIATTRRIMG